MFSEWIIKTHLRIKAMVKRRQLERDLEDELQFHLAMRKEKLEHDGAHDGRSVNAAARRRFGNVTLLKEVCREMWTFHSFEMLLQDLRFGIRALAKTPGFTAIAILTLTLGIGANTAIFSLVNGVVLRPLPYPQPDMLVSITDSFPQGALVAMRGTLKTMQVAGYSEGQELNLTGLGDPERLYGTSVSANFFSILKTQAERGRTFSEGEDQPGKDALVILSHALWQKKFGGDTTVIGRWLTLEGIQRQVIGVMPAGFSFGSPKTEFWIPLHLDPRVVGAYWGGGFMPLIGRLRSGESIKQAGAEIRQALPRLRSLFPWRMPDALWSAAHVVSLQESMVGDVRTKLLILLSAIGLVLLIACVNVANLLLSRASTRQREMAVRTALGAARWRICRQLLTESILLAAGGGGFGILLAVVGLAWLKAILPADTPRLASVSVDWRVLAFAAGVAILTGVVFGLAPALHTSKIDLTESLKTGAQHSTSTRSSHRLRSALAITEFALAVVLVIAAGLLVKSLWELGHVNPGFQTESIMTARITPNQSFCADLTRCDVFYMELIERTRAIPGITAAALVSILPLDGRLDGFAAAIEDHPVDPKDPSPVVLETVITPEYLQLMGIPLLRGRGFNAADMSPDAPPVALITAAMAQKFWPNQSPIGKHVKPVYDKDWTTIVGVVGDVNEDSLAAKWPDWVDGAIYDPYGNSTRASGRHGRAQPTEMTLVVKTLGTGNFAETLRKTVAALNPEAPVSEIETLPAIVSKSLSAPRSTMTLFAIFAVLALVLGAVGIYGVVSYSVAQRTSEIGVRMALGAQQSDVLRLVIGQGTRLALSGVAIGLGAAFTATRFMSSLLYGVSAADPGTFVAVAILLVVVALGACYIPARRATQVDPMIALRHE